MTDSNSSPQSLAEDFYDILGTDGKALSVADLARLAAARPVTAQDVVHLCNQHPYLDLCNADVQAIPDLSAPVKKSRLQSGWLLHDRGDRLTIGIGRLSFGRFLSEDAEDADDEGGQSGMRPPGTIVQQMFDSAFELIGLCIDRWPSIHIIAGNQLIQSLAWIAAEQYGVSINYDPTPSDREAFTMIKNTARAYGRSFRPR